MMRTVYLTGSNVYVRAMVEADKECGIAWFNTQLPMGGFDNVFPVDTSRSSTVLKEENRGLWPSGRHRFAIVRKASDEVVGALVEDSGHPVVAHIGTHMAPAVADADALRAEAVELVVPWIRDERQFRLVRMSIPADQTETISAAESVGMSLGARLRSYVARPGSRVDLLMYETVNPDWTGADA